MERSNILLSICDRRAAHPSPALLNTPLQRGVSWHWRGPNCFNGFRRSDKTVETVTPGCGTLTTPLKRGVNEMQRFRVLSHRVAWVLGLLILVLPTGFASPAAPEQILTVAVFDFESKDEAVRDLGPKVATLVNANLSAEPQIMTVERAELEKVLGEQELGLSGTVSAETAAKVGHLTGAKVLVTGRVFKVDKELVVVSKIIGTETSRVYGELVKGTNATPITDLSTELAKKIAATVNAKGETLVAKVESREDRIARIKKSVGEKPLPSVSVKIGERHFGQPVIDPAAETELGLILKECGFTLVDDKSPQKPDVEITGDAFSAFGMRKGNLISCKARVELKAQKRTGEILCIDRQTSVAVDIAEQTAAKAALQKAATEVAERLAPKLAR